VAVTASWQTSGDYRLQLASDVDRDGMGCELLDGQDNFIAEVFRCDSDRTLTVSGEFQGVPLAIVDWFVAQSKRRLDPFEDGTPLAAILTKPDET